MSGVAARGRSDGGYAPKLKCDGGQKQAIANDGVRLDSPAPADLQPRHPGASPCGGSTGSRCARSIVLGRHADAAAERRREMTVAAEATLERNVRQAARG